MTTPPDFPSRPSVGRSSFAVAMKDYTFIRPGIAVTISAVTLALALVIGLWLIVSLNEAARTVALGARTSATLHRYNAGLEVWRQMATSTDPGFRRIEAVAQRDTLGRQLRVELAELANSMTDDQDRDRVQTILGGLTSTGSGAGTDARQAMIVLLARQDSAMFQAAQTSQQAGDVDFSRVITFNLDEYYPMTPDSPHSYHRYMWENFFAHVNIAKENVHIPEGVTPRERVMEACAAYEGAIRSAGGIDFQLLGIGKTGHVGFNEPGSDATSRTRIVTLDTLTRKDAAADFFGVENVPREAITMGVATILDAKEIALLATGEHKAGIVARAVEGEISPDVAATFLQRHQRSEERRVGK